MLSINDETRQGALRFLEEPDGPFLAMGDKRSIPPLIDLPKLLSASDRFQAEEETAEDLWLLLAPGSSLGGARPKASVRDSDGQLAIAKFPHKDDETNVVVWEFIALELAEKSGTSVPSHRLFDIDGKPVLLIRRSDRIVDIRILFLSAMSMLQAKDNDTHSYL